MTASLVIATGSAGLACYLAWRLDQRLLGCGTRWRAVVSIILLGIAVWVATLIHSALLLKVPGAYGPVQYWVGSNAAHDFISGPRVWALFSMLGGMWIAGLTAIAAVVSIFLKSERPRWTRLIVPSMALVVFALAYYWFIRCGFYPSA
jgi:hypothetical protein